MPLEEVDNEIFRGFFKDLLQSTHVIRDNGRSLDQHLDLDHEYGKWVDEFDEQAATGLKAYVDAAIPDYQFLRHHRLQI